MRADEAPPERAPLLEVENLDVAYGKVPVVHGASFRVHAGEFISVLGRNGAGKTTMLRAISGLIPKGSGRVRFAGADISHETPERIVRSGLVHVLEGHRIFPSLTVADNLLLAARRWRGAARVAAFDRIYALFPELAERRRLAASRLSGGLQQILAVGQGMIAAPRLLVLDEPSGGLAPLVVDRILDVAASLCREGAAIILVEQLVEKALRHSHHALVLETGRIVYQAPAAGLAESEVLREIYLGGKAPA